MYLCLHVCHQHFNDHFTTLLSLKLDPFQLPQLDLHSALFCYLGKYWLRKQQSSFYTMSVEKVRM